MTEKEYKEVEKMLRGWQKTTLIYSFGGFVIGVALVFIVNIIISNS